MEWSRTYALLAGPGLRGPFAADAVEVDRGALAMVDAQAILLLGTAAAILQLMGYLAYLRDGDIEPNPVTWLMFSYGTLLLTVLEWDRSATLPELLLPLVCSFMAIFVAGRCWRRSYRASGLCWPREWWPEDWRDRAAFQTDLLLTALYLGAALLLWGNWIGRDERDAATIVFLIAANLTTFTAFYPLIRNVIAEPHRERTAPWAIWTAAYCLLGVTTLASQGGTWNELMIYPVVNALMHGMVAVLSRKSRRDCYAKRYLPVPCRDAGEGNYPSRNPA